MSLKLWVISLVYAVLSAVNAIAWGYAVRTVGEPAFSLSFLLRLVFNKYFIIAMAVAFTAAVLSYVVLREMGVLAGRFFLSLNIVATIIACTLVLGERLSLTDWVGIALVTAGVLLIGRAA